MSQAKNFKEEFAKFCESPDRTKLRELLKQNTGEYAHIDFKERWPEIPETAKHVLGFANSGAGVLVIGISEEQNGSHIPKGIDAFEDKTNIKSKLQKYLPAELEYDIYNFEYDNEAEWGPIKNKQFQVLLVEDTPQYLPFLSLNSSGNTLHRNRVYYRGKTNTEEATHEELKKIINRRLDTNISTTAENQFKEHFDQLKILYLFIDKYIVKAPFWMQNLQTIAQMGSKKERNPRYPTVDFEDFVLRMIERKKEVIESMIGRG
ncbi:MAG: ATP-binding protein [Syntrophorhabdaceae bacterium]|nr:ATP-binding protein [Syntrophorhabdaceae bacterium]